MRGLQDDQFTHFTPKGPPPIARIILVLVISIGLMALDNTHNVLDPLRDSLSAVMQPILVVSELPAEIMAFAEQYLDRAELIARNNTLERKILLLKGRLQKLAALKAENRRLRNLMASEQIPDHKVVIAEIMAVSPSPYRHYITLNKGYLDGIRKGQTVIDAHGVMGQIVSTTPMTSTAIMITDPSHTIPVKINRTGLRTIARGRGKAQQLVLPFLPANTDIRVGDLLVTSGIGGDYPAGYPVAKVTKISHQPGEEFLTVIAEPVASLNRGHDVLVLVGSERQGKPSTKPAQAAASSDKGQQATQSAAGQ